MKTNPEVTQSERVGWQRAATDRAGVIAARPGSALAPCLGCGEFAFQVPVGGFQFEDCPDAGKV